MLSLLILLCDSFYLDIDIDKEEFLSDFFCNAASLVARAASAKLTACCDFYKISLPDNGVL